MKAGTRYARSLRRGSEKGVRQALRILADASRAMAPRDTGALQASCRVRSNGDGSGGRVVYTAAYAAYQHENTRARHASGEAKYLSKAARDSSVKRSMARALITEIKKEWG